MAKDKKDNEVHLDVEALKITHPKFGIKVSPETKERMGKAQRQSRKFKKNSLNAKKKKGGRQKGFKVKRKTTPKVKKATTGKAIPKSTIATVYKIENTKTAQVYIGVTQMKRPIKRWQKHCQIARHSHLYIKNNNYQKLHRNIQEYGEANFSFIVLEYCSAKVRFEREQYWIAFYGSFGGEKGLNCTAGGAGGLGTTHSEFTRISMSLARRGKNTGTANVWYGHHHTEENRAIMSAKAKARPPGSRNLSGLLKAAKARAKLSTEDVKDIRVAYMKGASVKELAAKYGVKRAAIYKVLKYQRCIDFI